MVIRKISFLLSALSVPLRFESNFYNHRVTDKRGIIVQKFHQLESPRIKTSLIENFKY